MTSLPQLLRNTLDILAAPVVQERVTRVSGHRPWPLPGRSWVMAQSWLDLLFAHWRVPPDVLRPTVPSQLTLDTCDGQAWIGVTPFEVRNLRLRPTPAVPLVSSFPEINVRTYVTFGGRPGIYFFSLDAGSPLAVAAARRLYRLPYFRARMSIGRERGEVCYATHRSGPERSAPAAAFRGSYAALGPRFEAQPGTLEHWLIERYCLYTLDERQRVHRAEIHHPPWPLQAAEAEIALNRMGEQIGVPLSGQPLLHYAKRQDVVFWSLERAG